MTADPVTICIPAYRAAAFLAETIESALAQSHPDIRIVIAVDPGGDATERIAQRYARKGLRVVINPRRLGWIRNTNYASFLARTRYSMVLPHDDIIDPNYVAACLDGLKRHPKSVVCYSDMDAIGLPTHIWRQQSIEGELHQRLETLLLHHFNSVAYRGLIDRDRAPSHDIPNSTAGYAADSLFLARLACQGELIRIPEVLCHKRMHDTSTHAGWRASSLAEYQEMWAVHCLEMVSVIKRECPDINWTDTLQEAWEARAHGILLAPEVRLHPPKIDGKSSMAEYISQLADRVAARPVPYSWVKS